MARSRSEEQWPIMEMVLFISMTNRYDWVSFVFIHSHYVFFISVGSIEAQDDCFGDATTIERSCWES